MKNTKVTITKRTTKQFYIQKIYRIHLALIYSYQYFIIKITITFYTVLFIYGKIKALNSQIINCYFKNATKILHLTNHPQTIN